MTLKTLITNIINVIMDGSFERVRIISQMNTAFMEYFTSGEFGRLCKVSITQGVSDFRHEMSAMWLRSGFKISIENDFRLTSGEMKELASYVTGNAQFVRQLMAMGFDTLVIKGKTTGMKQLYPLAKFANLSNYFIGKPS
ncbi:MAG: hypothetical protein LUC86_03280 [Prevotellaceae bacterium]|nr:hypothetical protein [Prevotellaceae bacterium]